MLEFLFENVGPFRRARWSIPEGLSVLVGPNGVGKTTLFRALRFWSSLLKVGLPGALQEAGGTGSLRNWNAPPEELVRFELTRWDQRYALLLATSGTEFSELFGETLSSSGRTLLERPPLLQGGSLLDTQFSARPGSSAALDPRVVDTLTQRGFPRGVLPAAFLLGVVIVETARFRFEELRRHGSSVSAATTLDPEGLAVFSVLRNWRDRRATRGSFDFVLATMAEAFPGQCEELEFEAAGQTVAARVFLAGRGQSVPHAAMSNGWLQGLLLSVAVAGAAEGSLLCIDELENGLHPHAIAALLRAFRERAREQKLSLACATHSPVVLDQFHEERDRVFVLDPALPEGMLSLEQHPDAEWLQRFDVGDSYARERVGAPLRTDAAE